MDAGPEQEMDEKWDDTGPSSPPFRPHKLLALCSSPCLQRDENGGGQIPPFLSSSRGQRGEIQAAMMLGHVSDKAFPRGDISWLVFISVRHTLPHHRSAPQNLPDASVSARVPSTMPGDPARGLTEHACSCRLPGGCFKALKYKATPRLTKHPKAPLRHTAQTPAPREATPQGHGDGEGEGPGSGGHKEAGEDDVSIRDLESTLKGIQVPPGSFTFNKQTDKGCSVS